MERAPNLLYIIIQENEGRDVKGVNESLRKYDNVGPKKDLIWMLRKGLERSTVIVRCRSKSLNFKRLVRPRNVQSAWREVRVKGRGEGDI